MCTENPLPFWNKYANITAFIYNKELEAWLIAWSNQLSFTSTELCWLLKAKEMVWTLANPFSKSRLGNSIHSDSSHPFFLTNTTQTPALHHGLSSCRTGISSNRWQATWSRSCFSPRFKNPSTKHSNSATVLHSVTLCTHSGWHPAAFSQMGCLKWDRTQNKYMN